MKKLYLQYSAFDWNEFVNGPQFSEALKLCLIVDYECKNTPIVNLPEFYQMEWELGLA